MAWSDNLPINSGYSWKEGTTTGSYDMNYVKTWMEWLVTDDSANNRSVINVKMYSQVITGGSSSDMAKWTTAENFGYAGYDNSNRVYRSTTYDFNNFNRNCFADATFCVDHNADGTKSITLQTAFTTHSSTVTGGSVSENLTLTSYPRGTDLVSVTGKNYGYPSSFNLSRKSSSFRERVTMSYGGNNLPIKDTDNANVNFTYTLPRDYTPNTTKPSASTWTITVATYNGATLVETKTYTETWSIKEGDDANYAPVITANPSCTALNSGFTGAIPALSTDTCVAQYSKLRVSANSADITFKYGAGLPNDSNCRKVEFSLYGTINGKYTTDYDTGIIYSAGTCHWVYTVTDSRGFTATKDGDFEVLAYSYPTLDIKECYRGDSSQNPSDSGTYIWVKAKKTINALNNHNSATIKAQATGFSQVTLTDDTRTSIATSASPSNTYTVTFTLTDLIKTVTYYQTIKSEDLPLVIKENGKGVGIGANPTLNNQLLVGYDQLNRGNIVLSNNTNYSHRLSKDEQYMSDTSNRDFYSNYAYGGNRYHRFYTDASNYRDVGIDFNYNRYEFYEDRVESGVAKPRNSTYINNGRIYITEQRYYNVISRMDAQGFQVRELDDTIRSEQTRNAFKVDGRIFGTCNLIDMASLEQGTLVDGTGAEYPATTRLRSGYTSVDASTTYTLSMTSSAVFKICLQYNASKGYVGYKFLSGQSCSFTTDANVAYVRITIGYSNDATILPSAVSNLQLEKGSSTSSYVPFAMDNVELTDAVRNGAKIPLTMSNCTAQSAWGGCWARITNNKVHIHLGLENLVSVGTSWLWISTLTTQLIPKNWVVGNGWSLDGSLSGNSPCVVMLDSSGNLYVCCTQYSSVIADFEYFLD